MDIRQINREPVSATFMTVGVRIEMTWREAQTLVHIIDKVIEMGHDFDTGCSLAWLSAVRTDLFNCVDHVTGEDS